MLPVWLEGAVRHSFLAIAHWCIVIRLCAVIQAFLELFTDVVGWLATCVERVMFLLCSLYPFLCVSIVLDYKSRWAGSCSYPPDTTNSRQIAANFAFKFPESGGFSTSYLAFLDEKFLTRKVFSDNRKFCCHNASGWIFMNFQGWWLWQSRTRLTSVIFVEDVIQKYSCGSYRRRRIIIMRRSLFVACSLLSTFLFNFLTFAKFISCVAAV